MFHIFITLNIILKCFFKNAEFISIRKKIKPKIKKYIVYSEKSVTPNPTQATKKDVESIAKIEMNKPFFV